MYYGFVQFKQEESAKVVLSQSKHSIGSIVPKVTAADDYLQPDFELILRMLDDVCLKEIFLRLRIGDLSNAADVCVRFKNAANWAFMKKFKRLDFDLIRFDDFLFIQDKSVMDKLIENVLRNFGSLVYSLSMINNQNTLELVSRYCANNLNLKQIKLGNVHITKQFVEKFRTVFKQLNKLHLRGTTLDKEVKDLFPICTELENLLVFQQDRSVIEALNSILHSNLKIRKILIHLPIGVIDSLKSFRKYLTAPSKLNMGFNHKYLNNLTMLNELTLYFGYQHVSPLLKSLVEKKIPIKRLCLIDGIVDNDAFKTISQMKNLIYLGLGSIYTPDPSENHLVELAKQLPELEELWFDRCSIRATANSLKAMISYAKKLKMVEICMQPGTKISFDDYNTMVEIVKSRKVKTNLSIKMKGAKIDVSEDIRAKNQIWLKIHARDSPEFMTEFVLKIEDKMYGV